MLVAGLSLSGAGVGAQQVPDTTFVPRTGIPAYALGKGPRLVIDGAHANFHTVDGRYSPFAKLASRDGYRVSGSDEPFSDAMLANDAKQNGNYRYTRIRGIHPHPIFNGRGRKGERVDSVVTFTGSAFWIPEASRSAPLLSVPADTRVLMPRVAWQFGDSVASSPGKGMLQGAALRVGKGRLVAAGEAAMFSAQRAGPQGSTLMGFNEPTAPQNAQFALNVLHWLSGLLPAQ